MQLAKKIPLNSAYGALAKPYFRWFKLEHAEAITSSGQLAIRWIEKYLYIFLNDKFETEDVDYVIAIDTDSVYVDYEEVIRKDGWTKYTGKKGGTRLDTNKYNAKNRNISYNILNYNLYP